MKKIILAAISVLLFINANSQNSPKSKLSINTHFISMYFRQKNGTADWEPTRKMKDPYTCKEQKDGSLHIKYSPYDTSITIYKPVKGNNVIGDITKLPNEIGGYKLKHLYLNPEEPEPYYHAIYTDSKTPGSMLIVHHIELGKYILGAAYFSNGTKNPFKEKGIHFKLPN